MPPFGVSLTSLVSLRARLPCAHVRAGGTGSSRLTRLTTPVGLTTAGEVDEAYLVAVAAVVAAVDDSPQGRALLLAALVDVELSVAHALLFLEVVTELPGEVLVVWREVLGQRLPERLVPGKLEFAGELRRGELLVGELVVPGGDESRP